MIPGVHSDQVFPLYEQTHVEAASVASATTLSQYSYLSGRIQAS